MNHVESFTHIEDLEAVAWDFSHLIPRNNQDIIEEFGTGATSFTGDVNHVMGNLQRVAAWCASGERQQFIGFVGEDAVGMARLAVYSADSVVEPGVAEVVDLSTPNFGAFVCNPYRGEGLGRELARVCRGAIDEHFGEKAWTSVQEGNIPSKRMVEGMGFQLKHVVGSSLVYAI